MYQHIVLGMVIQAAITTAGLGNAQIVWSDGLNTDGDRYVPATADDEGHFNEHATWEEGDHKVLAGPFLHIPSGWRYAQQDWNITNNYLVEPDTSFFIEGNASQKLTPGSGPLNDIFTGRLITGLSPGQTYTFSFAFQVDSAYRTQSGPGRATGDDFVNSASWGIRGAMGNQGPGGEDLSLGLDNPRAFGDMEDLVGHERDHMIWIGDPGHWDGGFHTHGLTFTPLGDTVAFVLKFRSMAGGLGSFRLDDLMITPEPTSLLLVGVAALGVAPRNRRNARYSRPR